ncbi:hypothetical protein [Almyronema epifaneia]|uniref:Transposase zinc-ribbon domain-containing protein n=1 Tax=Almyronema epifaneia S1 TaxID=2991925 RepID=A0ABW6I9W9_9CYAN
MNYKLTEHTSELHNCPSCGKQALVQYETYQYRCLWCGFDRDVSRMSPALPSWLAFVISSILLGLLL